MNRRSQSGLEASFQASACSRPPEPIRRIRMVRQPLLHLSGFRHTCRELAASRLSPVGLALAKADAKVLAVRHRLTHLARCAGWIRTWGVAGDRRSGSGLTTREPALCGRQACLLEPMRRARLVDPDSAGLA